MDRTNAPAESVSPIARKLRIFLIIVAISVLIVLLFYGEEDMRGLNAWSRFKHAEAAKGEHFSIPELMPPPVPDEQNFAMTPLLRPALDYDHSGDETHWRDTNAWQHLSRIRIDLDVPGLSAPKLPDLDQSQPVDLQAFAEFYRSNFNYPHIANPGNSAEAVLAALNKFEPDLKELREAAAARTASRFPIEYNYEPSYAILLPHLAPVKGITMVCELRAVAELELHRTDDALADLQLAFRMSDSIREEPILIDHLVRIATLNLYLQGISEGLNRHAWSDAQLAAFETNLASINLLAEYEHAMRGERALSIGSLDYVRRTRTKEYLMAFNNESGGLALRWVPSGWYYRNMLLIAQYHRDYLLASVDASNHVVVPSLVNTVMRDVEQRHLGPYNIFAKMVIPALSKTSQRTARAQTFLDETRVACAIERYRMQHHQIPDTLDALAPEFLPKIPNDLFTTQPLIYKKNPDGTFLLYSVGWNLTDDGGVVTFNTGSTPRANPDSGDWVWRSAVK